MLNGFKINKQRKSHTTRERGEDDRKILDFVAGEQQRNDQLPWEQLKENYENS